MVYKQNLKPIEANDKELLSQKDGYHGLWKTYQMLGILYHIIPEKYPATQNMLTGEQAGVEVGYLHSTPGTRVQIPGRASE